MSEQQDSSSKQKQPLQIVLDEDVAQGVYINFTIINHSETDFVFDFLYVQPQQPKAKVRSRIICNPKHASRMLKALQENIKLYEKKFGPIAAAKRDDDVLH